jgi:hypothetical protein
MRRSSILLYGVAVVLASCSPAGSGGNASQAGNAAEGTGGNASQAGNAAEGTGENASQAVNAAAGTGGNESQPGQEVSFRGCPRIVDVEKPRGCLVVKSGTETYDIDSAQPRPDPGKLIIEGTGIYNPETVGICMTGKILRNVKWHNTTAKCPIGKDKE